ncbi:flavin-containing monooxygenase [Mesobacillus zeae]|uniref:Oxidoreductase n=1 Tax=Mesobacillus zeae TaxID=1917180 RepID=A0A398B2V5_9BACI|nr:NAD(P)/FAD-dependent oxidoreductase [Mesobacillus zeae]RID82280.1 oxidoreductase [Mesobacillus zeae]
MRKLQEVIIINNFDVIVIGAGQAGLAMSYYLSRKNISHIVLDAHNQIGDSWRTRYDSLVLFTPRSYSSLPGMKLAGNQETYPTKDEVADYLLEYARQFKLPHQMNTKVILIEEAPLKKKVVTNKGVYKADSVVIATGPFQTPFTHGFSTKLSEEVYQVHSADYKNPSELQKGTTLIVGAGNSGLQIAAEIADRKAVFVSVGKKPKIIPKRILNKSLFWWFEKLRISQLTVDSKLGQIIKKNDPIIGRESKKYIKSGKILLKDRVVDANGTTVYFADQQQLEVDNIIWCTGFKFNYSWIKLKGALNETSEPIQTRGVSPHKGLYFLGLPWQHKRGSALLLGVGEDAEFLVEVIQKQHIRQMKERIANV